MTPTPPNSQFLKLGFYTGFEQPTQGFAGPLLKEHFAYTEYIYRKVIDPVITNVKHFLNPNWSL